MGGVGSAVTSGMLRVPPRNKALRERAGGCARYPSLPSAGRRRDEECSSPSSEQSAFDYPKPAIVKVPHSSGNNNEQGNSSSLAWHQDIHQAMQPEVHLPVLLL